MSNKNYVKEFCQSRNIPFDEGNEDHMQRIYKSTSFAVYMLCNHMNVVQKQLEKVVKNITKINV